MRVYLRKAVEDGKVIFPKKFVLMDNEKKEGEKRESIEQLRRDLIPSEFAALYLNDPVDSDAIEFKPAWFQTFDPATVNFNQCVTIMSIDPAFRLKQTNDFTGITIAKLNPNESKVYILEALALKLNSNDLINKIFDLAKIYNPTKVILETVAAQIVLLDMIRNKMAERKQWFTLEEVKLDTSETKAARIRSLIPFYANLRVYHAKGLQALEAQLIEFPRGLHDDVIDSLAHQTKFWKNPHLIGRTEEIKPGTFAWWKRLAQQSRRDNDKLFNDFRR